MECHCCEWIVHLQCFTQWRCTTILRETNYWYLMKKTQYLLISFIPSTYHTVWVLSMMYFFSMPRSMMLHLHFSSKLLFVWWISIFCELIFFFFLVYKHRKEKLVIAELTFNDSHNDIAPDSPQPVLLIWKQRNKTMLRWIHWLFCDTHSNATFVSFVLTINAWLSALAPDSSKWLSVNSRMKSDMIFAFLC